MLYLAAPCIGNAGSSRLRSLFDLDNGNKPNASYELTEGIHTLEFSGRSANFKLDRVHLRIEGWPSTTLPESPRTGGGKTIGGGRGMLVSLPSGQQQRRGRGTNPRPLLFTPYAPECVEGAFSELRAEGVLRRSPPRGTLPSLPSSVLVSHDTGAPGLLALEAARM